MKRIIKITEEQYFKIVNVNEDVFVNNLQTKRNRNIADLTYTKNGGNYNKGNKNSNDMLKTDRMDNDNGSNTYEVPLKGGMMSYNITDINGTEVMHYFKRSFEHNNPATTAMKIGQENYDLEMERAEFNQFKEQFLDKVSAVVEYQTNVFKKENKDVFFDKIGIYGVPSSSNFNKAMVDEIVSNNHTICGMPVQKVNEYLLEKNTENIQRDEDFINKNKEYYDSKRWKINPNKEAKEETHMQAVNTDMNMLAKVKDIENAIEKVNQYTKIEKGPNDKSRQTGSLLCQLNSLWPKFDNPETRDKITLKSVEKLRDLYVEYCNAVQELESSGNYYDEAQKRIINRRSSSFREPIAYTKGPSIKGRTERIHKILKAFGLNKGLPKEADICMWRPIKFQIKKFGNDTRMALKNYFAQNKDKELVKAELEKQKGAVIVVFDDNVSGGATLSDICMHLKDMGFPYIIPITFGKMNVSYNQGSLRINAPENGFNLT